jgi:hypothetical protein
MSFGKNNQSASKKAKNKKAATVCGSFFVFMM